MLRGALFSALAAAGADVSCVLDLYAGTGALGVEALSRVAGWCDFVERDRSMSAVISENLAATGLDKRADVHPIAAEQAVKRLEGPYTLLLADPPYADSDAWDVLAVLAASRLVRPDAVIAVEHGSRSEPPAALGGFGLLKTIRHGDSAISLFRQNDDAEHGGAPC
jgi:16S rRNA (guanine966-N2)-methyltransferase